jgi:hypothetical protein
VPACTADAPRVKEGFGPHSRQVLVDGRPTDYSNAPRHYGPWAGGYFQGFGGGNLLPALFAGAALGAGLGLGTSLLGDLLGDGGGWDDGGGFDGGDFGG